MAAIAFGNGDVSTAPNSKFLGVFTQREARCVCFHRVREPRRSALTWAGVEPGWRPLTAGVLPWPQSRQATPGCRLTAARGASRETLAHRPTARSPETHLRARPRPRSPGVRNRRRPAGAPWSRSARRPSVGTTAPRKRRPPPLVRRTRPRTVPRGSEARARLTGARGGRGFPRPVSSGLIWRALMAAVSSLQPAPLLGASLGGAEKARS